MSATAWLVIAIVGFSLAGVAFIVAVFMFFKMDILAIIGDLTGKTVAREIKAMRDANAISGDKRFRSSKVNLERGMITMDVQQVQQDAEVMKKAHASKRLDKKTDELSGNLAKRKGGTVGLADAAQMNSNIKIPPTEPLDNNATEVLSDNATEVLSENATEVLSQNATEVLSEGTTVLSGGTMVLEQSLEWDKEDELPIAFKVIRSEMVVHSEEINTKER